MSRRPLTETEIAAIQAIVAARKAGALYQILGLSPGASADQVDVAYKTYVREWHPDRFYTRDTGELGLAIEENFVEATQAWRTLKDPGKRAAWHREKGVPDVKTPTIPPVAPRVGTLPPVPPSHVVDPSKIVRKAEPPPPPAPPPKPRPPAFLAKAIEQAQQQVSKARQHYLQGKELFDGGQFARAETALRLATTFDPRNVEYAELHKKAAAAASQQRAKHFIALAEQEESYRRVKEAMTHYTKATECDPPEGLAWYKIAQILRNHEDDNRGALNNLRKAVAKEPRNVSFRIALAEVYLAEKLAANAQREFMTVLEIDPKNDTAKGMLKQLKR